MFDRQKFKTFLKTGYHGRILTGNFSLALKKRLSQQIYHLRALDRMATPAIPYISAWSEKGDRIWYEFASAKLPRLLDCPPSQVAATFGQRIIDRCIYKHPGLKEGITKEILGQPELKRLRTELRREVMRDGTLEAVYKVDTRCGHLWLKDQASLEVHLRDGICLSTGILFAVSKEMQAESQLKLAQEELQQHRQNLEKLVDRRTREVWETQLEIVSRLSRAAEFRDRDTGSHITKMSHYCAILGKAAAINKQANELLFHATPMHDIGKIGIADSILLKPGKLSAEEFSQMKGHSRIGADLLAGHDSQLLRVAQSIALTHHERWDGSGYPQGLHGQAIPLAGRIAAICDVFDALTSDRPYKKAWSFDRAVAEIHQGQGTHFDPKLTSLFLGNLPKIKAVCLERYPAPSYNA